MKGLLHVYSRSEEPWVLVPASLAQAVEARLRYGRLCYVGAFAAHRLTAEEHVQVMSQCDAASCAAVPARTALRLLAHEDPRWLRHVPHWLRPARKAPRGERTVIGNEVPPARR